MSFSSSALRFARTLIWRTTVPVIDGRQLLGKTVTPATVRIEFTLPHVRLFGSCPVSQQV